MIKQTPWFRPLLACLCVLVIGVAACNAPTEYEVQMGQKLTLTMADPAKVDGPDDLQWQMQAVVQFIDAWSGVEGVSVNVNEIDGGPTAIDLVVWGQDLDGAGLIGALNAEFPFLADAHLEVEPLSGTVEGNLGDALGHALFHLEVEGDTAEEIQASILQQIYEQGFTGDAVVDVHEEDGVQTINVELNDVVEDENGDQGEAEDKIVIERIQE